MESFLNSLEKFLTWFFALAFGALLIYGGLRYRSHVEEESDLLLQAKKQNTPEASTGKKAPRLRQLACSASRSRLPVGK